MPEKNTTQPAKGAGEPTDTRNQLTAALDMVKEIADLVEPADVITIHDVLGNHYQISPRAISARKHFRVIRAVEEAASRVGALDFSSPLDVLRQVTRSEELQEAFCAIFAEAYPEPVKAAALAMQAAPEETPGKVILASMDPGVALDLFGLDTLVIRGVLPLFSRTAGMALAVLEKVTPFLEKTVPANQPTPAEA